jgi:hypothetical protein
VGSAIFYSQESGAMITYDIALNSLSHSIKPPAYYLTKDRTLPTEAYAFLSSGDCGEYLPRITSVLAIMNNCE